MTTDSITSSARPNVQDARYVQNEQSIHKALNHSLHHRSINVRPNEICETAEITRPTFYAHCDSSDDALRKYESSLQESFEGRLPNTNCENEVVFTVLLGFVYDERGYFLATIPNSNFWLLNTMFDNMRPRLSSECINDRTYNYYAQAQILIIRDWVEYGEFSKRYIPRYVKKMLRTRFIDPTQI